MVTRFNKINARVIEIIRKKLPLELYAENLSEDLKEKYQYITKESFEKNEPPPYQLVSY